MAGYFPAGEPQAAQEADEQGREGGPEHHRHSQLGRASVQHFLDEEGAVGGEGEDGRSGEKGRAAAGTEFQVPEKAQGQNRFPGPFQGSPRPKALDGTGNDELGHAPSRELTTNLVMAMR